MDQLLDAIQARFAAQQAAGYLNEYHDDEPGTIGQYPAAFAAAQGPEVLQFTVGSPGKIITRWQFDVYYLVPLSDRRGAFRRLAAIAPLVMFDWLRNRRLGGVARDLTVGQGTSQTQGRGQFVNVPVAGIEHRAFLLPLFIEVESTI